MNETLHGLSQTWSPPRRLLGVKIRIKAPQYAILGGWQRGRKGPHKKDSSDGNVLVGRPPWCGFHNKVMCRIPNLFSNVRPPRCTANKHHKPMTILPIWNRHCRTFPRNTRESKVACGSSGLLHLMDWSWTTSMHLAKKNDQVLMEKHPNEALNTEGTNKWQWIIVFRESIQMLVYWTSYRAHPQANGQTEVSNRKLVSRIKKCPGKAKGNCVDEVLGVL